MRLIDADALCRLAQNSKDRTVDCNDIMRMPTVDTVPVVHGEWISDYDGFEFDVRCSVCGEEALIKEGGSHDHAYSKYCPNCGAKMDSPCTDCQEFDCYECEYKKGT